LIDYNISVFFGLHGLNLGGLNAGFSAVYYYSAVK